MNKLGHIELTSLTKDQTFEAAAEHQQESLEAAMAEITRGSILPRPHFVNCLRIEKRRADRSKTPFSMALFRLSGNMHNGDREKVEDFLSSLNRRTRETDIKGWLEKDLIAVLLPDTDQKGAQAFIQKVSRGKHDVPRLAVTATYPDDLFHRILNGGETHLGVFPLDLGERRASWQLGTIEKRALDIAGSLFGIVLFSPLMAIIAAAVKYDSSGPILFNQTRLGRKGKPFLFHKFRTMYANTDDQIHRKYVSDLIEGRLQNLNNGDESQPFYKIKDDPRVTRVGRILRKLSLDELPQFFNVLKGEMSLVGPRPPILYEVEKYESWHLRRILEVKPGITGFWQVNGRNTTTFPEMVRLDLRYVKNWSFWLDLKILMKTIQVVLQKGNTA